MIHPTAIIIPTAKIGEGVVICPYCLVSDNVQLDDFVMMNTYASCGHDVQIVKYCVENGLDLASSICTID